MTDTASPHRPLPDRAASDRAPSGCATFDNDPLTALDAMEAAQRLAFGPLAFQASLALRDRGVLAALEVAAPRGASLRHLAEATGLSTYATRVLLEAGLGMHLLWRRDGTYHLGRLGRFVLDDEMTRVNFDFVRDVCFEAAARLDASLVEGRPLGLPCLGPWKTLYAGLSSLPEPARSSWFAFDHFYSDQAFPVVCRKLAAEPPTKRRCACCRWAVAAHCPCRARRTTAASRRRTST